MQTTKCAIFIDCENIPASCFTQIIDKLGAYQLCAKKAYANWRLQSSWSNILDHYGIEPVQVFHKGLKNSSDLRLSLDCLQMAYEKPDISCFALITSDSDFRHLVFKLLDLGKEVIGFGESKTDNDFMAIYTQFYTLKLEKTESEPVPKKEPKSDENFLKELVWACANSDDFISINKINAKMLTTYGKNWNIKLSGFNSWANFFKNNSALFELNYENKEARTGMKIRLKENALLKL